MKPGNHPGSSGYPILRSFGYPDDLLGHDKENNQEHNTRLMQILPFSCTIFEDLLSENLTMEKIDIPLNLYNENVNSENFKVLQLQKERYDLIETILYQDSINELLEKWKDIIKKMACEAIPKRIGVQ
ncbi:hypothetical protein Glove_562g47 [Diversispora epigaea]|uniref:Uncharacterized protein n=1 Tax=Diversispora epigaea TaxID=1348612 RepID=A0A397GD41_9GLOM|nr:hypothetical protein Glove_562g47 [Diversispora epigaea]